MTESELAAAVGEWPDDERMAADELTALLAELHSQRWVIRTDTDAGPSYKVNLARKAGNRGMSAIYETLDFEFKPKTPPRLPDLPEA
jgi:hypothetical protein